MQLHLMPNSDVPLYKQIADGIRSLIDCGALGSSTRLPSTRKLADDLGVSRCTASQAYEELIRFGYIVSPSHVGTFVSCEKSAPEKSLPVDDGGSFDRFSTAGERLLMPDVAADLDAELFEQLNYFSPSLETLPDTRWFGEMSVIRHNLTQKDYVGDVFGSARLRKALASLLMRTKGIQAREEQICVFSSAQLALDVFARLLINPGDSVLVENPGFPGVRRSAAGYNGVLWPISVDFDGIVTAELWSAVGKLLYVSPGHQMPTGVTLSQSRRTELLSWADHADALIIEDDFDTEYNFAGHSACALKSLDSRNRVIYLSSFWTTLFPLCRLAFAVVPSSLTPALRKAKALVDRHLNVVEQDTLAAFLQDGSYERHVKKTRLEYARNREFLIATLNRLFGSSVVMTPSSTGTTLAIRFNKQDDFKDAIQAVDLPLVATKSFYLGQSPVEFLLSFTGDMYELEKRLAGFKEHLRK